MKPFDLERAKAGDKVITRDGRAFKFGAYNPKADEDYRVAGWVDGKSFSYSDNGSNHWSGPCELDLFMAPKRVYMNVYRLEGGEYSIPSCRFDNEETAIKYGKRNPAAYIKTICIDE